MATTDPTIAPTTSVIHDGLLSRSANLNGSVTQSSQTQTYTFATANKFVDKDIALQIKVADANYIKTVTSVPTTKETNMIYNSTTGKYYVWKD